MNQVFDLGTRSSTDPRVFIHGGAADSKYFQDMYCYHTTLGKVRVRPGVCNPAPSSTQYTVERPAPFVQIAGRTQALLRALPVHEMAYGGGGCQRCHL